MSKKKKRNTKRVESFEDNMPEQIDDTPENIMRALLETPPKKTEAWEYQKTAGD